MPVSEERVQKSSGPSDICISCGHGRCRSKGSRVAPPGAAEGMAIAAPALTRGHRMPAERELRRLKAPVERRPGSRMPAARGREGLLHELLRAMASGKL
ncbi:hypothetical protein MDA_GLEAN10005615 [Myotis davidii]|uniref:Uncharacterized protein n=1 Tax=Myotis davidii TaxID=225400 RepID=L5LBW9_MYODS|nr:hypothetical protein MDA_GLEAN10005615 [Myotis davidii]